MPTPVKVDIIGDNQDAIAAFKDTSAAAKTMGQTIQGIGLSDVGERMQANVTEPIIAGLSAATQAAVEYESVQIDIEKSLGLSTEAALDMSNAFLDLAPDLGIMPGAMAAIAVEGGKMGVAADDVDEFAESIARSSVALDIAAEETGERMAKITAAYGLPATAISQLSADVNALGDGIGGLNEDIIMSVGRASTMARIYGVTASETAAFSAVMNKQGIEAERIGTALNRLFNTLSTVEFGTEKAKAALVEAGTSAQEFKESVGEMGAARATQQLLEQIAQMPDAARQTKVLLDLFGRESADEIGALVTNFETMGDALDVAADKGANMNKFNAEFEKRSRSAAFQQEKFRSNLEGFGITIGRIVIPAMNQVMGAINPIISGLADFAEINPVIATAGVVVAGLAAAIAPLLIAVGSAITAWTTIAPIVTAAGVAIAGVSAPVLLIGGLLVGLAATIGYVAANWDQFSSDWMGGARIIGDAVTGTIGSAMNFLGGIVTGTFELISGVVRGFIDFITPALQVGLLPYITFATGVIWAVDQIIQTWQILAPHISAGVNAVSGVLGNLYQDVVDTGSGIVSSIADMGGSAIALSAEIGEGIYQGFLDYTAPIRGLFSDLMGWIWDSLNGMADRAFQAGAAIIKSMIAGINSQFQNAINTLNSQLEQLRSYLPSSDAKRGALSDISSAGTALMETFAQGIDAAPATRSLNNALQQPRQQLAVAAPRGGGSGGGGNIVINYSPTVYGGGSGGEGKDILEQLEQHSRQLINLIDEARSRKSRADLPN